MTDINTGPILWTIINFLILLFILAKLGWKPITQALAKREQAINDALDRAEKAQEDANRVLASNREILAKAETEAQDILRQSRDYAQKVRDEAMGKAEGEAHGLIERAKDDIERSKKEALSQLRSEVATIAVNASEKILKHTLDKDQGQKLVQAYLNEATEAVN